MTDRPTKTDRAAAFAVVEAVGLTLPGVAAVTKYDGSPGLQLHGCFMAGLATHGSAEPGSLVIRASPDDREGLLADAPDTYYVTDYYRRHPVVLVRLARVNRDALRELLTMSWRLTAEKSSKSRRSARRGRAG